MFSKPWISIKENYFLKRFTNKELFEHNKQWWVDHDVVFYYKLTALSWGVIIIIPSIVCTGIFYLVKKAKKSNDELSNDKEDQDLTPDNSVEE